MRAFLEVLSGGWLFPVWMAVLGGLTVVGILGVRRGRRR
jgi:hypothetical protein